MDRIWAQYLGYQKPEIAVIVSNFTNNNYGKAVNLDGARLKSGDIQILRKSFPRLLNVTKTAITINSSELFAETVAVITGGGATPAEQTFIAMKFKCQAWYVTQLRDQKGIPPAVPDWEQCYHVKSW
jgi:hypothetical protein